MDWPTALRHLPWRLVVADRKGRVLLLSGDLPNVKVGRSFLKVAHADEIMQVGRTAKRSLTEGAPRKLRSIQASDGTYISIRMIPFDDHLLVVFDEPHPPSDFPKMPTPPPTTRRDADEEITQSLATTAPMHLPPREPSAAPTVPPAAELVVVGAGGTIPLARALVPVLSEHVKTSTWPMSRFVDAVASRAGASDFDAVERSLDPSSRVLFIGESPWTDAIRDRPFLESEPGLAHWALSGTEIRAAAIWTDDVYDRSAGDVLADIQFEMMEIVRKSMPIRRQGRVEHAPEGLKRAATFLEQPEASEVPADIVGQARHQLMVIGIARFLQDGLEELLSGD